MQQNRSVCVGACVCVWVRACVCVCVRVRACSTCQLSISHIMPGETSGKKGAYTLFVRHA